METKEVIRGVLSFMADDGVTEYEGPVEAIVWNMPGLDFIVGLPDIAKNVREKCFHVFQSNFLDHFCTSNYSMSS